MARLVGARRVVALALVASACTAAGPVPSGVLETAGPSILPTVQGEASAGVLPTRLPESVLRRVPTRIVVPGLGIDLPVIAPPDGEIDHFPYCDVAEFLPTLSRPGRPGATFIYAHARAGMFLPIHDAALRAGGRSLVGLRVHVYSSDDRRFAYEVTEVRRHVVSLDFAYRATAEQLVLQTSEGPRATPEKTVVIAMPRGDEPATRRESRPEARPVRCG